MFKSKWLRDDIHSLFVCHGGGDGGGGDDGGAAGGGGGANGSSADGFDSGYGSFGMDLGAVTDPIDIVSSAPTDPGNGTGLGALGGGFDASWDSSSGVGGFDGSNGGGGANGVAGFDAGTQGLSSFYGGPNNDNPSAFLARLPSPSLTPQQMNYYNVLAGQQAGLEQGV